MDIVIPFKHSVNNDEELRMALRSIDRNLIGANHAWIVGDIPKWRLNGINATVIPFADRYVENHYRDRNILNKLLRAAIEDRIPPVFMVAHDDNFIMHTCDIEIWPYYHKGNKWTGKGDYALTEANTKDVLNARNNYDIHCPHQMYKLGIAELAKLDWKAVGGYCIKTAYAMLNRDLVEDHEEFYTDLKINAEYSHAEVADIVTGGRRFFSCGDIAFRGGVKNFLLERFPNKSKYEL